MKLEGIVTVTVTLVLGAAMLVYVGNTTLYLAPPNPVTAQLLPVIRAIQNPLFAQNWHLFAPDPVKSDFVLTVRCRTKDEVSAWQDITAPLLARHQSARTSPLARGRGGGDPRPPGPAHPPTAAVFPAGAATGSRIHPLRYPSLAAVPTGWWVIVSARQRLYAFLTQKHRLIGATLAAISLRHG